MVYYNKGSSNINPYIDSGTGAIVDDYYNNTNNNTTPYGNVAEDYSDPGFSRKNKNAYEQRKIEIEIQNANDQFRQQEEEIKRLQGLVQRQRNSIAELADELRENERRAHVLNERRYRQEIRAEQETIKALGEKLAAYRTHRDEVLERIRKEELAAKAEVESKLQDDYSDVQRRIELAQSDIVKAEGELDCTKRHLGEITANLEEAQAEIKRRKKAFNAKSKKTRGELQERKETLTKKNHQLEVNEAELERRENNQDIRYREQVKWVATIERQIADEQRKIAEEQDALDKKRQQLQKSRDQSFGNSASIVPGDRKLDLG